MSNRQRLTIASDLEAQGLLPERVAQRRAGRAQGAAGGKLLLFLGACAVMLVGFGAAAMLTELLS